MAMKPTGKSQGKSKASGDQPIVPGRVPKPTPPSLPPARLYKLQTHATWGELWRRGALDDGLDHIREARHALDLQLKPSGPLFPADPNGAIWRHIYDDRHRPLPAELVEPYTVLKGSSPKRVEHFETIACFDESFSRQRKLWGAVTEHQFVSRDWKSAIEDIEPGRHEFFPHELRFEKGAPIAGFIFRERSYVYDDDFSTPPLGACRCDLVKGEAVLVDMRTEKPVRLKVRQSLVVGRHWIAASGGSLSRFVSEPLARRLLPLLPDTATLLPVDVEEF